ncbi:hypothetical protein [Paraburkholderia sp. GAS334]|uniref:hypothetical protein n=1 Tax=Paraburkholderia sp. GAS334 TaxID=3035131 RepID=UPI003D1D2B15
MPERVFLDMSLRDMDGTDECAALRQHMVLYGSRIIAITGSSGFHTAHHAARFDARLIKPSRWKRSSAICVGVFASSTRPTLDKGAM